MSDNPDACNGRNPSPMSSAAVTATGVPNPADPSKKEPKAKAISTSCTERSVLIDAMLVFIRSNAPCSAVNR